MFLHPYRHELLQFYDHHAKLAAGYNQSMQSWRDTIEEVKWPLQSDPYAVRTVALMARKAAEHYEIADGARRLIMGEGNAIAGDYDRFISNGRIFEETKTGFWPRTPWEGCDYDPRRSDGNHTQTGSCQAYPLSELYA